MEENKEKREQRRFVGKTNIPDYGVPSGVQLTENLNEEIAEAVETKTEETTVEKK